LGPSKAGGWAETFRNARDDQRLKKII